MRYAKVVFAGGVIELSKIKREAVEGHTWNMRDLSRRELASKNYPYDAIIERAALFIQEEENIPLQRTPIVRLR